MKKIACLLFACALCSAFALVGCSGGTGSSAAGSSGSSSAESASASATVPASSSSAESASESAAAADTSSTAVSAGAGVSQADIEEMIVGTWVSTDRDGQPELTNDRVVFDFISDTKARVSAQFELHEGEPATWAQYLDADVAISGDKVTITDHPAENATAVSEFTVTAISPEELTANHKLTLTVDGEEAGRMEGVCSYVKVDVDYGESILGTWEAYLSDDGSELGDDHVFRSEFKADGTYLFYVKKDGEWVLSDDTMDEYYVAGNLLSTRWVINDEEKRSNWEIAIDGDEMSWNALREGDDGKPSTKGYTLKKVA